MKLMRAKLKEVRKALRMLLYRTDRVRGRASPSGFPCPATSVTHGHGKYQRIRSSIMGRQTYLWNFLFTGDIFSARVRCAFETAAGPDRSAPMQDNDRLKRLTNIKEDETSLLSKKGEEWDGGQPPSKKKKKAARCFFVWDNALNRIQKLSYTSNRRICKIFAAECGKISKTFAANVCFVCTQSSKIKT